MRSPQRGGSGLRRVLVVALTLVVGAASLVGVSAPAPAAAADLSQFSAGNIISDSVFYNSGTMTEGQVQSFLEQRVSQCQSGYTCLRDYVDTTRATSADAMCAAYPGGGRERASTIIFKVAQACGINPQVLIVMLQKEQGLVTHTWPSNWRYTIAMGQGCPDTAACDTQYYGFFNQVYGAAWQLKRYANPPGTSRFFTWYAPGNTWNIRFNPNAACGSSPVYVQNQATAALYYYTPYQPNASALRAGYGEGDGCGAYGNRNFFQYFTDWFGSTQGGSSVLFAVGLDLYLISGQLRYHIPPDAWPSLREAFGGPTPISASYLSRFTDGGIASLFVRSGKTGEVAYIQGTQTHWFDSCDLVARWGGSCSRLTELSGDDFERLSKGLAMTVFGRSAPPGNGIYRIEPSALTPMFDSAMAASVNGGKVPYAAYMPDAVTAGRSVLPTRFAPAQFILLAGDTRVWLPTADGRLVYLPSWQLAAELGLPASPYRSGVPQAAVDNWAQSGDLSSFVSCNGAVWFGAGGALHPVAPGAESGFAVTTLDADTCAVLPKATESASGVFLTAPGSPAVYSATGGVLRHVTTPEQLVSLAGSSTPRVLSVSAETLSRFRLGASYVLPGELVRVTGTSQVYIVDGARFVHLPSWAMATAGGWPTTSRVVSPATIPASATGATLAPFVRCGGDLYVAGGGGYSRVASNDAAGNAVTDFDLSTCNGLRVGPVLTGAVLLTDGLGTWGRASGGGFVLQNEATVRAANGGQLPLALTVGSDYLASLPVGR